MSVELRLPDSSRREHTAISLFRSLDIKMEIVGKFPESREKILKDLKEIKMKIIYPGFLYRFYYQLY